MLFRSVALLATAAGLTCGPSTLNRLKLSHFRLDSSTASQASIDNAVREPAMTQYRSNQGPKTIAWRRTNIARFVAGIGTIMLLMLAVLPGSAQAATFTPTTFTDVAVSSLGAVNASGQITDQGNAITLRSAVIAANALGATNTIILGAGTYILSIPGTGETASAGNALIGDLDVLAPASGTVTLTVQGAGASVTTIQQTSGIDRIFDLHPINLAGSINFTLTGVTVKGGNITAASGGAMLTGRPGDVTNLTNCVFDGNISPNNGGAISQSSGNAMHNLTITNCVFSNNSAGATGGAVQYAGQGIVTITGSTFVNNTAGTDGGALNLTGAAPGGTHNISTSNFSNNTANGTVGGGGAIGGVQGQALNAHFNRFVGNLAPLVPTGKVVSIGGGTFTGIDLNTNWWGVNTGPAATDRKSVV